MLQFISKIKVNGVQVTRADILLDGGVMHEIGGVLHPVLNRCDFNTSELKVVSVSYFFLVVSVVFLTVTCVCFYPLVIYSVFLNVLQQLSCVSYFLKL